MITRRIAFERFQQIPAFRNFNESECHQLLEVATERTFAPGDKVVEQGKDSQTLWVLLEGQCQVIRDSQRDGSLVLAELEPNSLFGEMSFFSPAPHSAHVVAKTPVRLLSITRADYDDLIRDGVTAAYKLAYNVVGSVATRLRRMDDWIDELAGKQHSSTDGEEKQPEWRQFRKKMFDGWNI